VTEVNDVGNVGARAKGRRIMKLGAFSETTRTDNTAHRQPRCNYWTLELCKNEEFSSHLLDLEALCRIELSIQAMTFVSVASILASRNKQVDHDPAEVAIPPLLALPLELRREIYSYLLPCTNCDDRTYDGGKVIWNVGNIALFSVCHQLYEECAAILYGENIYEIRVEYGWTEFIQLRELKCNDVVTMTKPLSRGSFEDRVLKRMRWVVINIQYIDDYTGESHSRIIRNHHSSSYDVLSRYDQA